LADRAIGVFDSGIGGLTVLKALLNNLPGESLVYLGDTARVPYGTKSSQTVRRYALEAASFLVGNQVKLLVCACNTASSVALQDLESRFTQPIVGVIEPGARRAVALTRSGKVGIIGTEGTIKSGAYTRAVHALNPDIEVFSAACPLFVPLVEEGWADHAVALTVAREYLAPMLAAGVDTLVLGCTHYPVLKSTLHRALGPEIELVDSAEETAITVAELLRSQDLTRRDPPLPPRFFVTDEPDRFLRVGRGVLGLNLERVEKVEID